MVYTESEVLLRLGVQVGGPGVSRGPLPLKVSSLLGANSVPDFMSALYSLNSKYSLFDRIHITSQYCDESQSHLDTTSLLEYACHKYLMTLIRKHQLNSKQGTTSLLFKTSGISRTKKKAENHTRFRGRLKRSVSMCSVWSGATLTAVIAWI